MNIRYAGIFFKFICFISLALAGCGSAAMTLSNPPESLDQHQWVLSWSDEFNGPDGSAPDPAHWTYDLGGEGWGNQELECYTNDAQNSFLQGGNLVIQALSKPNMVCKSADGTTTTNNYTSARLTTAARFDQAYGKFEARVMIPYGQGLWPAFWLLGSNISTVGWPACGEIDIMENIGKEPAVVHGSIHGPGSAGENSFTADYTLPNNQRFADDFHVFAVEWSTTEVRFLVDGKSYEDVQKSAFTQGPWVFDHPFFILLNVAVGGSWPGNPDATTAFPQTMKVDYVRVYK
jgi:beta-glucanase (GH16 family)